MIMILQQEIKILQWFFNRKWRFFNSIKRWFSEGGSLLLTGHNGAWGVIGLHYILHFFITFYISSLLHYIWLLQSHSILFRFALFYSILLYFDLFYSILLYFTLCYAHTPSSQARARAQSSAASAASGNENDDFALKTMILKLTMMNCVLIQGPSLAARSLSRRTWKARRWVLSIEESSFSIEESWFPIEECSFVYKTQLNPVFYLPQRPYVC